MSKVIRSVKNVTKGYSSVQVKVRNGECTPRRGARGGAPASCWSRRLMWMARDSHQQRSLGSDGDRDERDRTDDLRLVRRSPAASLRSPPLIWSRGGGEEDIDGGIPLTTRT